MQLARTLHVFKLALQLRDAIADRAPRAEQALHEEVEAATGAELEKVGKL